MKKQYKRDEIEDIFKEEWFKSLPWYNRVWIRLQVAFYLTITSF